MKDSATTEIYTYRHTLSLHDALPISDRVRLAAARSRRADRPVPARSAAAGWPAGPLPGRSEEHTAELQPLMRTSYAVFFLTKNNISRNHLLLHFTTDTLSTATSSIFTKAHPIYLPLVYVTIQN